MHTLQIRKSATLLTNRGVVNQFMGDIVSAMNDYKYALKLDSTHVLAHFNVGNVLFHQRLFDQAVMSYTKAISHCPRVDDAILVNRAIAYSILRDREKALGDFGKAIEANPYSAHAYFNRGNLYRSLEEYEKAEEDYKMGEYFSSCLILKQEQGVLNIEVSYFQGSKTVRRSEVTPAVLSPLSNPMTAPRVLHTLQVQDCFFLLSMHCQSQ